MKLSAGLFSASVGKLNPAAEWPVTALADLNDHPFKRTAQPQQIAVQVVNPDGCLLMRRFGTGQEAVSSSSFERFWTRIDAAFRFSTPNSFGRPAVEIFPGKIGQRRLRPTTDGLKALSVPFSRFRMTLRSAVPASPPLISRLPAPESRHSAAQTYARPVRLRRHHLMAAAVSTISDDSSRRRPAR